MTDRALESKICARRAQLDQLESALSDGLASMSFGELTRMMGSLDGDLDRVEKHNFVTLDSRKFRIMCQCTALVIGRNSLERAEQIVRGLDGTE